MCTEVLSSKTTCCVGGRPIRGWLYNMYIRIVYLVCRYVLIMFCEVIACRSILFFFLFPLRSTLYFHRHEKKNPRHRTCRTFLRAVDSHVRARRTPFKRISIDNRILHRIIIILHRFSNFFWSLKILKKSKEPQTPEIPSLNHSS